jgi:hypothetical protein
VRVEGQPVTVRPSTMSASTRSHGPLQIAAIGLPASSREASTGTAMLLLMAFAAQMFGG